jgi:4-hydroxyphenylpyruvate dioxygenase-like putative hemolysin
MVCRTATQREPDATIQLSDRELAAVAINPLAIGIEFIEYSTSKPQALSQVLEMMGLHVPSRAIARAKCCLYRQGDMNVIVNAHAGGQPARRRSLRTPVIAASRFACATLRQRTDTRSTTGPGSFRCRLK